MVGTVLQDAWTPPVRNTLGSNVALPVSSEHGATNSDTEDTAGEPGDATSLEPDLPLDEDINWDAFRGGGQGSEPLTVAPFLLTGAPGCYLVLFLSNVQFVSLGKHC
jgi:hypothetical protein